MNSMILFDNVTVIRENHAMGVTALANKLSVPAEELKSFMLVNDIPVL